MVTNENNTMADERLEISSIVEADQSSPTKTAVVAVEQTVVVEEVGKASPSGDRSSPETNCAICLGKPQNKSFTDSCFHQFCFTCLLEWSKVKAECPLCKQSFKSIIHNVRSIEDYEQYYLRPAEPRIPDPLWPTTSNDRFRTAVNYLQYIIRLDDHIIPTASAPSSSHIGCNWRRRRQNGTSDFRRNIYRQGLYVQRTPDVSGRFRTSSPEFYRLNPAQVHRLVPWLNRELNVLLNENRGDVDYVMQVIMDLITRQEIRSPHFHDVLQPYFGEHTHHFIHEFHSFATSPFDMIGFDQNAQYVTRDRLAHSIVTEVPSSSSDSDSDVQVVGTYTNVVTRDRSTSPVAGPSAVHCPTCVDIESDSDDCEIIGTLKPKHERTPEIITLDSDSEPDVVDGVPDVSVTVKTSYSSDDTGISDREDEDFEAPSTSYRISTRSQTANRKRKSVFESSDEEYSPLKQRCLYTSSGNRNHYYQSRVVWFSDSQSNESSSSSSSSDERYGSRKTKKSKGKKKKSAARKSKKKSRRSKESKKRNKITKYWKKKICSKSEVDTSSSDTSRANSPVMHSSKSCRRSSVRSSSPESSTRNIQEHNYSVPYTTDELNKFVSGRPRLRSVVTVKTDDSPHSSTAHGYTSHENSRLSDMGGSNRRSDSDDDYVSSSHHRTNSYSPSCTYELDHGMSSHTPSNCVEMCPYKYTRLSSSHIPRSTFYNGGSIDLYKRARHGGNSKYPLKKRRRDS